jgi:hypothetical protein
MSALNLAVCVRPSTHGLGVFTCRHFRRREKIGRLHGDVIHDPAYGSRYAVDLGQDRRLEPAEPFRFLNHSCQPNCELLDLTRPDAGRNEHALYVKALRPIAAGEELTIDYAWSAEAAIVCGCRAAQCRGWIVAADQLPRVLELLELRAPARANRVTFTTPPHAPALTPQTS